MTKDRILKIVYIIIAIAVITLLFINDNGVIKFLNLKNEISQLDEKIETTKLQIGKLNSEIDSLKNSDIKIEQVARDKYHMKYKNEIPVRINKQ